MDKTIDDLTEEFNSIQKPVSISETKVTSPSKNLFSSISLKKVGILATFLLLFSIPLLIFFLDPKFYRNEDGKLLFHYILLDLLCITAFLFLTFLLFQFLWKKFILPSS